MILHNTNPISHGDVGLPMSWVTYNVHHNAATDPIVNKGDYTTSLDTTSPNPAAMKFADYARGNYRLRYDSPFKGQATDGTDMGVDIDALEAVQGKVTSVSARLINRTTATISYFAPDEESCVVEWSVDPSWGTGPQQTDAGGDRARNVNLTGLTPATHYHYRVLCAVEQPFGAFRTQQ
jgi:hypothetical protein